LWFLTDGCPHAAFARGFFLTKPASVGRPSEAVRSWVRLSPLHFRTKCSSAILSPATMPTSFHPPLRQGGFPCPQFAPILTPPSTFCSKSAASPKARSAKSPGSILRRLRVLRRTRPRQARTSLFRHSFGSSPRPSEAVRSWGLFPTFQQPPERAARVYTWYRLAPNDKTRTPHKRLPVSSSGPSARRSAASTGRANQVHCRAPRPRRQS
jgi:hypothetical protein